MWDYTDVMMDHFKNPRNLGEVKDANAVGMVGNLSCGDALKISMKVNEETNIIEDIKFKTFGCGSAIAASSALTEMVLGKTVEEALSVTNLDIADFLGGLPAEKMHCSVMGKEALEEAVKNYRGEESLKECEDQSDVICKCFLVTRKRIERVIKEENLTDIEDVINFTKAGSGCGGCIPDIKKILEKIVGVKEEKEENQQKFVEMTMVQKIQLIDEKIKSHVRPELESHGGDLEFVSLEGTKVIVKLKGVCAGCAGSKATLKNIVEAKIKEHVFEKLTVEEV